MGQWRSLPSKETKKLFLLKLATARMDLLAHLMLHPPCFLETLWLQWNPPTLWTIPQFPLLSTFSECEHLPSILNSLLFLSPHQLSQYMQSPGTSVSSSCPLQNSCPAFSTLYNIFSPGRLACMSHSASNTDPVISLNQFIFLILSVHDIVILLVV